MLMEVPLRVFLHSYLIVASLGKEVIIVGATYVGSSVTIQRFEESLSRCIIIRRYHKLTLWVNKVTIQIIDSYWSQK